MTLDPITMLRLIARAVHVAQSNVGFGEDTVNNEGRFLDLIGSQPGWEWCAVSASYPYRRAAQLLELDPPAWCYRRAGVVEPGARALVHAMGKVGRLYRDPSECQAGDLALWTRWVGLKRKAHVGFIELPDDGLTGTIEGNVGRVPAKLKRLTHDVSKEPHFEVFASIRR